LFFLLASSGLLKNLDPPPSNYFPYSPLAHGDTEHMELGIVEEWLAKRRETPNELENDWVDRLGGWAQRYSGALLRNAIVAAWSAFEVLAGDLWEVAVNRCPMVYGARVLQGFDWDKKTFQDSSAHLLLRRRIGTLAVQRQKVSFKNNRACHSAFKVILGEHEKLDELLSNRNDNLRQLAAYRHVLVHRGGHADAKFNEDSGLSVPLNKLIPLQGETVGRMLTEASNTAVRLMQFLHVRWIEEVGDVDPNVGESEVDNDLDNMSLEEWFPPG
jgi:hypothetical protein